MSKRKDILHTLEEWSEHYYSKYAADEGWAIATPINGSKPELVIIDSTLCNKTEFQLWHYLVDLYSGDRDMLAYSALGIIKHTNFDLWWEICNQTNIDTIWKYAAGSPYKAYVVGIDDYDTRVKILGTGEEIQLRNSINNVNGVKHFCRITGFHDVEVVKEGDLVSIDKKMTMQLKYNRIEEVYSLTCPEDIVEVTEVAVGKPYVSFKHGKFHTSVFVKCFLKDGRMFMHEIKR